MKQHKRINRYLAPYLGYNELFWYIAIAIVEKSEFASVILRLYRIVECNKKNCCFLDYLLFCPWRL